MIRLLSTDFDGTLIFHEGHPPVSPALFEALLELRRGGAVWAINTGRALDHILEGLREFRFPLNPDFVLTSERHVYRPASDGKGWEDFGDWNARCDKAHEELLASARPLFEEIVSFVESETEGKAIFDEASFPAGLIASSDAEMDRIVEFIDRARFPHPSFHYQRNTMYLRFCHVEYSKGAALRELGRLLGISRDEIFAAGDHFNDLSMLDGESARWVACPANSAESVKVTVRAAGGYVAGASCSEGIVQALRHFGAISSHTPPKRDEVLSR
jgi:HAD superfamily hydrolase (TIGR01484 family)